MRICIYGAGASGGYFALKLAATGHDVAVIARGPHLAAMQESGITLIEGDERRTAYVRASDDPAALGLQDVVLVVVKSTGLAGIVDGLPALVGPRTLVAFVQNGIGWWYPEGLAAHLPKPPDLPVFTLGERFRKIVRTDRVLGGSIFSANEVVSPGVIQNSSPNRNAITLGAISPGGGEGVEEVRAALAAAGIQSPPVDDIRRTIWSKLMSNMSGSTLALATENRSSVIRSDPALSQIYLRLVREGLAIARAHGYPLEDLNDPDRMLAGMLDNKPSLLQDFERGRPMEIAEIIQAPAAFARVQNVATPTLDALAAIVTRRARDRGLYR